MSVTIYHNPRCSKSRQTLKILQEQNQDIEIVKYLITPPDMNELEQILNLLELTPRQLMRKGESVYRALNLKSVEHSDTDLMKAMVENPILIERPIVIHGDKAVIGRPPDNVLKII